MDDKCQYRDIVTSLAYVTNALHDFDFLNGDPSILYLSPRFLRLCADGLELLFPPIKNDGSISFVPKDTTFESFIKSNESFIKSNE